MSKSEIYTAKSGDSFVGIEVKDDKINVFFPMGYHRPEQLKSDFSDKERNKERKDKERKEIRNLIYVIEHCSDKKDGTLISQADDNKDFPLRACLNIIEYYLKYQTFYTNEIKGYTSDIKGKTNFKRTIRVEEPYLQDEDSFVYLKRQVVYRRNQTDLLITQIHKWCTYQCFKMLGWLYCDFVTPKPTLQYKERNKKLYIKVISDELKHTYNDDRRLLFTSMINFLNNTGNCKNVSITYGTNKFQIVWERLIDNAFGDKKDFSPKATFHPCFQKELPMEMHSLRPDTVMKLGKDYYILDAKYYSYGIKNGTLPQTADVNKQITYAEKAANEYKDSPIYNAFIMPFDQSDNRFQLGDCILNVGYYSVNWYENWYEKVEYKDKPYSVVQVILIDTKYLMDAFVSRDTAKLKKTLAKNIREAIHF